MRSMLLKSALHTIFFIITKSALIKQRCDSATGVLVMPSDVLVQYGIVECLANAMQYVLGDDYEAAHLPSRALVQLL